MSKQPIEYWKHNRIIRYYPNSDIYKCIHTANKSTCIECQMDVLEIIKYVYSLKR